MQNKTENEVTRIISDLKNLPKNYTLWCRIYDASSFSKIEDILKSLGFRKVDGNVPKAMEYCIEQDPYSKGIIRVNTETL